MLEMKPLTYAIFEPKKSAIALFGRRSDPCGPAFSHKPSTSNVQQSIKKIRWSEQVAYYFYTL